MLSNHNDHANRKDGNADPTSTYSGASGRTLTLDDASGLALSPIGGLCVFYMEGLRRRRCVPKRPLQ